MARSYQGLVNLEHRRAFLRVVYATLREGRVLCSGDLGFALSGCGETVREVRAYLRTLVACVGVCVGTYVCVGMYVHVFGLVLVLAPPLRVPPSSFFSNSSSPGRRSKSQNQRENAYL